PAGDLGSVSDAEHLLRLTEEKVDEYTRLFVHYCGVNVGMTLLSFNDMGYSVGDRFTPLLHTAMSCWTGVEGEVRVLQPLRYIVQRTGDMEERDPFGRTPLLATLEMVHRTNFPAVAHMLLHAGAD